jgi:hypothetical protein
VSNDPEDGDRAGRLVSRVVLVILALLLLLAVAGVLGDHAFARRPVSPPTYQRRASPVRTWVICVST